VTRTPLSRSKGQGHQTALYTAALTRQATAAVSVWEHIGRGKLLLRCVMLGGARLFGAHRGRRGAGHIVTAARLQLVKTLSQAWGFLMSLWRLGRSQTTSPYYLDIFLSSMMLPHRAYRSMSQFLTNKWVSMVERPC